MSHAKSRSLLTVVFVTSAALSAQRPDGFDAAWTALVDEQRAILERDRVVGASLAFVHGGEIVAREHYGRADIAAERPVDEHTIFHWASITKTFTAVCVMQLRDRGLLALDDPITRYVPELAKVHDPFGSIDEITIRHLLSHSSGFRNATWPWTGSEPWHPHEPTAWSQLVAMMPYTEIEFAPGSRYGYSNPGIVFVGRALEDVTGDVYEAYVDKNVFDVLGMHHSYFDTTPWRLRPHRSESYRIVDGEPEPQGDFNTGITVANGGLNATVDDIARWVGFLMGAPEERAGRYDDVLPRTSLTEMWQPVVTVSESSTLGRVHMGLSFFLYERDGHRIVGHTGTQRAFRTFVFVDSEADVALIGAYNTSGGETGVPDRDAARTAALEKLFPVFWKSEGR